MEENNVIEDNIETDSEKIKRLEAQVFQLKNIILKLVNIARIFHDYLVKLMSNFPNSFSRLVKKKINHEIQKMEGLLTFHFTLKDM